MKDEVLRKDLFLFFMEGLKTISFDYVTWCCKYVSQRWIERSKEILTALIRTREQTGTVTVDEI